MLEIVKSETKVTEAVHSVVADVMTARGLDSSALASDAKLTDGLGLKSMDLAEIVLTLEDLLDCDPFQEIAITSIRTFGDLTGAYLSALGLAAPAAAPDLTDEMAAARARRGARRR